MKKLLVFAGTTEGRLLVDRAVELRLYVTVCVATDYGRDLLPRESENITVHTGRMDKDEMAKFMLKEDYFAVIDATHPYAVEVSKNIKAAAQQCGRKYLRLLRDESSVDGALYAESLNDAVRLAEGGNILATTGSKEIEPYSGVEDYIRRVFLRVLPTEEAINKCLEYGFPKDHIIAEKGPFTKEENIATINKYSIKTLITKDGGKEGGFFAKIDAAKECGIKVVVVKRPVAESGYNLEEIIEILKEV